MALTVSSPSSSDSSAMNLNGLRVLVTRPAHQAEPLCLAIEAAGGHALRQPLLAIKGPHNEAAVRADLGRAGDANSLIFTSANAVDWAWRIAPGWQPSAQAFAVGRATALKLQPYLTSDVRAPDADYSSEGLLQCAELQACDGRQISIITGEQGREELAQTLTARGARVQTVAVYQRANIPVARTRLQALLSEVDVVFISSAQSLRHLHSITPIAARRLLFSLQLVVPSSRVVKLALELGFSRTPQHPSRMQIDAILAALHRCRNRATGAQAAGK